MLRFPLRFPLPLREWEPQAERRLIMAQNVKKAPPGAVEEALERLLSTNTWSEYYAKIHQDPRRLSDGAGRFRAALAGLGHNFTDGEVRVALFERAGLKLPGDAPGPPRLAVVPDPAPAAPPQDDFRDVSGILHALYADGGRVELRADGHLYATRPGGLTEADREAFRCHGEAFKHLLSPEVTAEVWAPAVHYVARHLQRAGALEGRRYDRAVGFLNEAQEAYEEGDNGRCRYELRRAALASRKDLEG